MIELQVNRSRALFRRAGQELNAALGPGVRGPAFSYWATYYGENPQAREDSISLMQPALYNKLEGKISVARLCQKHGCDFTFPSTYESAQEALKQRPEVSMWFVKPSHLSGGRGIEVLTAAQLATYEVKANHLIQEGISDIALIDGKKFTGRVYVLLTASAVQLFDDGFIVIHGVDYEAESTDYRVQVDHRGYDTGKSGVRMMRLLDLGSDAAQIWSRCKANLEALVPMLLDVVQGAKPREYLMLGLDYMVQACGGVKWIEINAIPNFVHTPRINRELNVPFFEQSMRWLYGLDAPRLKWIAGERRRSCSLCCENLAHSFNRGRVGLASCFAPIVGHDKDSLAL